MKVWLTYNVVVVLDICIKNIGTFFFRFFSIIGYCRILNILPCAIQ